MCQDFHFVHPLGSELTFITSITAAGCMTTWFGGFGFAVGFTLFRIGESTNGDNVVQVGDRTII